MPTPTQRGTLAPLLQKETYTWENTRGSSYQQEWKGLGVAQMISLWNSKVFTAQRASLTYGQGTAEMRIEWAGSPASGGAGAASSLEVTLDRWECPEPKLDRPVFAHPKFLSGIVTYLTSVSISVTDANVSSVIAFWNKYAAQKTPFALALAADGSTANWATFAGAYPALAGFMLRSYNLVLNDQTHYQSSAYALRHTTNCPNYWSRNVADSNVNCILSPAQFMAEATDASLWYFPLPGRLQYKLAAAMTGFAAVTPARDNYLIGWLKSAAAEATVAAGRIEVQNSYVFDQWSTDLYAPAS